MPDPLAIRPTVSEPAGGTAVADKPAPEAKPTKTPERGDGGKFKPRMDDAKIDDILTRSEAQYGLGPSPEETAATKPKAEPKPKTGQGDTPAAGDSSASPTPEQLRQARSVLARDGYDPDTIDMLVKADPAKMLALASHREKVQTDIDAKLSKRGKGASDTTDQDAGEGKGGDTAAKPGEKAPAFKLDRVAFKDEIARLGAEFGPGSERVVEFTERVMGRTIEAMQAKMEERVSETTEIVQRLMGLTEELLVTQAKDSLKSEMPELADDAAFQMVREEMDRQARVHRGKSIPELMKLSSRVVLGDQIEARRLAELKARDQSKANGSVDLDGAAGTPAPESLDLDALYDDYLAELERTDRNEGRLNAAKTRYERAREQAAGRKS